MPERRAVRDQLEQERLVARPDLAQEECVDDPRGLDHPRQRAPLALGQAAEIGADLDGAKRALIARNRASSGGGAACARLGFTTATASSTDSTRV